MELKKLILPASLLVLLIILMVLFFGSQGKEKTPDVSSADLLEEERSGEEELDTKKIVLFFISEDDYLLHKEEREILNGSILENQIERLVKELISGSEEGLLSPFPPETKVRGIYITRDGIVYIDFSPEFQTAHPSGSSAEISSIFSIVNSIAYNFKSIKRVFILVNGTEQETLAGHIDLRRPFLPRYDLISD
ncbi:MAG: GerMN domain-containing protein [Candidatus Aminicenantes bacterium]|nr:GerMN domain-containing protein [Candidatus Aminicenantes bacterium]